MSDIASPVVTVDARRAALVKALRKYSDDGYAVALSADGLTATLSRKSKISLFWNIILTLITGGIWLIVILIRLANRKTKSVVLYVDESGKVIRA